MKDHPIPPPEPQPPRANGPHILVIGGGASGVLAASHILRADPAARVTLVEPRDRIGLGLAYSTPDPNHLLNVRARNMSALEQDPVHLLDWLAQQGLPADPDSFVTRRLYGRYLADLLSPWREARPARFRRVCAACIGLTETARGIVARLDDGTVQMADHAILATGHTLPRPPEGSGLGAAWDPLPALAPGSTVVILGTGLTMVDQVLSLLDAGFTGRITALSRRGLLPQAHEPGTPLRLGPQDIPFAAPLSVLSAWLRALSRNAEQQGGTWRDAIDGLRPHISRLWRSLPPVERARFLRHAQRWWDIHRHRMPPQSASRIQAALASGQLVVQRGAVVRVTGGTGQGVSVQFRPYQTQDCRTLNATLAIDARGQRCHPAQSPLLARLIDLGLARIDPLGIGLDITAESEIVAQDGTPSRRLSAIGPVSRAAFWEITAIPDIRKQAAALARRLVGASQPTPPLP